MKCPNCNCNLGEFNDEKLINFCKNKQRSITDIAKELDIAPKNVSIRVKRLQKDNLIIVKKLGKGKKTLVMKK